MIIGLARRCFKELGTLPTGKSSVTLGDEVVPSWHAGYLKSARLANPIIISF